MSTNLLIPPELAIERLAEAISTWQKHWTAAWHQADDPGTAGPDLESLVRDQHRRNYLLWHEEDKARAPKAPDAVIAEVKRRIDRLNQERNDRIERIDEFLLRAIVHRGTSAPPDAPWNTETPGNSVDRLSILSLKVFHMREQEEREDAAADHREKCRQKRLVLERQQGDLAVALQQHLDDVFAGRRQVKVYRQFKMYNDPSLNPEIYGAGKQ